MRVFLFLFLLMFTGCQNVPVLNPVLEGQKATLKKVADAMKQSGDMQSAAVIEQKLILLDKGDDKSFIELSKTLLSIKKKDEAISVLGTGIEVMPESNLIKLELVKIYLNDFKYVPAREVIDKITIGKTPEYYNMLGVLFDLEGNGTKARESYRAGLDIEPANDIIQNNLALSHLISGNNEDAVKILEKLVDSPYASQKYKSKYRQNLALAYGVSGKDASALKMLSKDLSPSLASQNLGFYKSVR